MIFQTEHSVKWRFQSVRYRIYAMPSFFLWNYFKWFIHQLPIFCYRTPTPSSSRLLLNLNARTKAFTSTIVIALDSGSAKPKMGNPNCTNVPLVTCLMMRNEDASKKMRLPATKFPTFRELQTSPNLSNCKFHNWIHFSADGPIIRNFVLFFILHGDGRKYIRVLKDMKILIWIICILRLPPTVQFHTNQF